MVSWLLCGQVTPPYLYNLHFQQKPYYTWTTATKYSPLPVSVVLNSHVCTFPIYTKDMNMSVVDTAFSQVMW